jgi:CII-binding regulator of phage lambda lysogenization HflD
MTLEAKIIRDLNAGPSTTSALADRLRVRDAAVDSVMQRLLREEKVRCRTLAGMTGLVVWKLAEDKKEVAP